MKLTQYTLLLALMLLGLLVTPSRVFAKRVLPKFEPFQPPSSQTAPSGKSVGLSVKFRSDRKAVILTATNLGLASSVTYELTYLSKGISQGAGGALSTVSNTATPTILFGTCSSGVCRYDSDITNARLTVTTTLKNGRKVVKPYRLKV